ncbi:MAG: response regulator [Candidatus Omnitrophica bacterium]|nr:response regulator [Candidatus Omnitrophota bacterium]
MNKIKVLVVDDEVDYLALIQEHIESWGYDVLLAESGKEALAIIKEKKPDIVVLDYLMPNMDGTSVLKEIRKSDKDLFVIMLTAYADINNIKAAQELGVSAFIPKLNIYSPDIQATLMSVLDLLRNKINEGKV